MLQKTFGIILAAGTGSRLGKLTKAVPKALMTVGGEPLIKYAISFLHNIGVEQIFVVGGFCFEDLKKTIKAIDSEVKIFENKDYLKGNLYTLDVILNKINGNFLLMNVDHIYHKSIAGKVRNQFKNGIIAFTDNNRKLGDDDMKVFTTADNFYVRKISKQLKKYHRGYVGMTYCHQSMVDLYKKAVNATKSIYGDNAVVENVLQVIANDRSANNIFIGDISNFGWLEIDFLNELEKACREVSLNKKFYI